MNISYSYGLTSEDLLENLLGDLIEYILVISIVALVISVILIISWWKIFAKNNKPGWYSIIPFLNVWTFFEIVGLPGWLSLIPGANIIAILISYYKVAKLYDKGTLFAIGTVLLPIVFLPIIAFSKDSGNTSVQNHSAESVNQQNINTYGNYDPYSNVQSTVNFPQTTNVWTDTPIHNEPVNASSQLMTQSFEPQPMNQPQVNSTVNQSSQQYGMNNQFMSTQQTQNVNQFVNTQQVQNPSVGSQTTNAMTSTNNTQFINGSSQASSSAQDFKICPKCGGKVAGTANNCFMCGTQL